MSLPSRGSCAMFSTGFFSALVVVNSCLFVCTPFVMHLMVLIMVLMLSSDTLGGQWPLTRVLEVCPGADGKCACS